MARAALPFLPSWRLRSCGWVNSVTSRPAIGLREVALYQQYHRKVSSAAYDVDVGNEHLWPIRWNSQLNHMAPADGPKEPPFSRAYGHVRINGLVPPTVSRS